MQGEVARSTALTAQSLQQEVLRRDKNGLDKVILELGRVASATIESGHRRDVKLRVRL